MFQTSRVVKSGCAYSIHALDHHRALWTTTLYTRRRLAAPTTTGAHSSALAILVCGAMTAADSFHALKLSCRSCIVCRSFPGEAASKVGCNASATSMHSNLNRHYPQACIQVYTAFSSFLCCPYAARPGNQKAAAAEHRLGATASDNQSAAPRGDKSATRRSAQPTSCS